MDPVGPGLIGAGGDHAPVAGPADDDGPPRQRRVEEHLHGGEEGVEVDVEDPRVRATATGHARGAIHTEPPSLTPGPRPSYPRRAARPERLPQLAFEDLARPGTRQLVEERDRPRHLVPGEVFTAEGHHVVDLQGGARPGDD